MKATLLYRQLAIGQAHRKPTTAEVDYLLLGKRLGRPHGWPSWTTWLPEGPLSRASTLPTTPSPPTWNVAIMI